MDIMGIPSQFAVNEETADAWTDGKTEADRSHMFAETFGENFPMEPTTIPVTYQDGGELEAAYRDGYRVMAQDLADDSART